MKRIKKVLLVFLLVICLTGCKADYTLEISDNLISEKTLLYSDNKNEYNKETYDGVVLKKVFSSLSSFRQKVFVNDDIEINVGDAVVGEDEIVYTTSYVSKNGIIGTEFSYNYTFDEYNDAYVPNTQIRTFDYSSSKKYLDLELADTYIFKSYPLLDTLNVTIKVDTNFFDVENHNADKVKNNTYTWTLTSNNYLYRNAKISLERKDETDNNNNNPSVDNNQDNNEQNSTTDNNSNIDYEEKDNSKTLIIVLAFATLIIIGFGLVLIERKNNNNRI